MMFGIGKYVLVGGGVALALSLAWGFRVDHLRAGYKAKLDTIRIAFKDMGETVGGYETLIVATNKVGAERTRYKTERDNAFNTVDIQNKSIAALQVESDDAARRAAENRKLIATVTQQRDMWIKRARSAQTRTERLSAQEELDECVRVLNDLYQSGF